MSENKHQSKKVRLLLGRGVNYRNLHFMGKKWLDCRYTLSDFKQICRYFFFKSSPRITINTWQYDQIHSRQNDLGLDYDYDYDKPEPNLTPSLT